MRVRVRVLAAGPSANRTAFGLAYLLAPARTGPGWIGRVARDPATQVFRFALAEASVSGAIGALSFAVLERE
jgi:hypothetical protein